jgi:DNA mismatch endonuclease, patch repair protein
MDRISKEQRSKNMRAVRSSKTKIENLLAHCLWHNNYRYRRNDNTIYGKPDFVFKSKKIAVFCDSEFWHGKNWSTSKFNIKSNTDFWFKKIERNIERDNEVSKVLTSEGWLVVRFWGRDILKNPQKCFEILKKHLDSVL